MRFVFGTFSNNLSKKKISIQSGLIGQIAKCQKLFFENESRLETPHLVLIKVPIVLIDHLKVLEKRAESHS